MARKSGISESSVGRIWAANGLKPHRIKSFKLSNDKNFEEKLEDIIGLYLIESIERYIGIHNTDPKQFI